MELQKRRPPEAHRSAPPTPTPAERRAAAAVEKDAVAFMRESASKGFDPTWFPTAEAKTEATKAATEKRRAELQAILTQAAEILASTSGSIDKITRQLAAHQVTIKELTADSDWFHSLQDSIPNLDHVLRLLERQGGERTIPNAPFLADEAVEIAA